VVLDAVVGPAHDPMQQPLFSCTDAPKLAASSLWSRALTLASPHDRRVCRTCRVHKQSRHQLHCRQTTTVHQGSKVKGALRNQLGAWVLLAEKQRTCRATAWRALPKHCHDVHGHAPARKGWQVVSVHIAKQNTCQPAQCSTCDTTCQAAALHSSCFAL
jgi:hypothetical protein